MKLNLRKTNLLKESNVVLGIICFISTFIVLYFVCTLFASFISFELSSNIFNISEWAEFSRMLFAICWLLFTIFSFAFIKDTGDA